MQTYVALLRGVNIRGNTQLPMADLHEAVASLGHTDVRTYIRSGNVLFRTAADDRAALAAGIQRRIADRFGVSTVVLLRTAAELDRVVAANPYADRLAAPALLQVVFLDRVPALAATSPGADATPVRLAAPAGEAVELTLLGREVYFLRPGAMVPTKVTNNALEKRLGTPATTRNWSVVTRLRELARG